MHSSGCVLGISVPFLFFSLQLRNYSLLGFCGNVFPRILSVHADHQPSYRKFNLLPSDFLLLVVVNGNAGLIVDNKRSLLYLLEAL